MNRITVGIIVLLIVFLVFYWYTTQQNGSKQSIGADSAPTTEYTKLTDNLTRQTINSSPINFYVENDQCGGSGCKGYVVPLPMPESPPCPTATKYNWNVVHEPGANGKCSDLIWHYTEPKMVLRSTGLNCNSCNGPAGNVSDATIGLDGNIRNESVPL